MTSDRAEVRSLTMLLPRISTITMPPITAVRKKSRGNLLRGSDSVSVTGERTSGEQIPQTPTVRGRSTPLFSASRLPVYLVTPGIRAGPDVGAAPRTTRVALNRFQMIAPQPMARAVDFRAEARGLTKNRSH